jgi:hypothetical protein
MSGGGEEVISSCDLGIRWGVHETNGQKTDRSPTMSASQCVSGMKAEMGLICAELEPDQTYMSDWLCFCIDAGYMNTRRYASWIHWCTYILIGCISQFIQATL